MYIYFVVAMELEAWRQVRIDEHGKPPPIVCCTGSPGDKDIQLLHDRQSLLEKETDWKKNSFLLWFSGVQVSQTTLNWEIKSYKTLTCVSLFSNQNFMLLL